MTTAAMPQDQRDTKRSWKGGERTEHQEGEWQEYEQARSEYAEARLSRRKEG